MTSSWILHAQPRDLWLSKEPTTVVQDGYLLIPMGILVMWYIHRAESEVLPLVEPLVPALGRTVGNAGFYRQVALVLARLYALSLLSVRALTDKIGTTMLLLLKENVTYFLS